MGNRDIWDEIELAGKGEHLEEEMFEFLSAYADDECSPKERRLVEAYLAESAAAREVLADLRAQAAFTSEGTQDAPEWLRNAILSRTSRKPRLAWPFAAGIGATAAAAASFAFVLLSNEVEQPSSKFIAALVPQDLGLQPPDIETPKPKPNAKQPDAQTKSPERSERVVKAETLYVSTKSQAPGNKPLAVPEPSKLIVAEKVPDPEVTYAVAEYGGGKFEDKQPDVDQIQPSAAETNVQPRATSPTVLPDAREKLRDRVKKINEEKLEIDTKERTGSK
jgi:hypothetical protein